MNSLVIPSIEALKPYEGGKPLEELYRELGITDAVKLASNENPLGPSPMALKAVKGAVDDIHRYPDAQAFRLRQRLSEHLGVSGEEIIFGAGSNEVIELLIRTFTTAADHVVFSEPSFSMYRIVAMGAGVQFSAVPVRNWTHDLEAVAAAVTESTRLVLIDNPNNPLGTYASETALLRFLEAIPKTVIVALDEAYFEYVDAADYPDGMRLRSEYERLVVLRTFSKIYGLAGLRAGYGIAPRGLVDYMNRLRAPFNLNNLAQAAALAALSDADHVKRSKELNRLERASVSRALRELGVDVVPSQTNFVLVDLHRDAMPVYEALLKHGVIVRPLPPLPSCVRITIGTRSENTRMVDGLREVLG